MTQQKRIFTPDNDGIFRDNKVDNLFLHSFREKIFIYKKFER